MKLLIRYFAASAVFLLGACQTTPMVPMAPLVFNGPSFRVNVANITVVEDYQSSKRLPHVESFSDITPAQAVREWANTHLTAAGQTGTLEVDIEDAGILREDLGKETSGVTGLLTKEQTEKYNGSLKVTLKLYDGTRPLPISHIEAATQRTDTLAENATYDDRDRLIHNLSLGLMHGLEQELDTNIRTYFSLYLLN